MRQSANVRYTIDKEQGLIVTTAEGSVKFDDIKSHQDRLLTDPDFDENFDQLIDTTAVTKIDLSVREVKILAERRVVSPESRRAIIANEPHLFGLGRMMQVYHHPFGEIQVFRSVREGSEWIGIEEAKTSGA
jgi:hypothetical protein